MKELRKIQVFLENFYEAPTDLDIRNFVSIQNDLQNSATLKIHQLENHDLNLSLEIHEDLLKRECNESSHNKGILFEEVSHFVYLAYNHEKKRNITRLELEIQSELDRILCAFHLKDACTEKSAVELEHRLHNVPYDTFIYEFARKKALFFVRKLNKAPKDWSREEFAKIYTFFHRDLSEKIHSSRKAA